MDDMKNVKLYENESAWMGTYQLSNGDYLECWEWTNPEYSDDEDIPDGAVYYDILNDIEAYDGGIKDYFKGETFNDFMTWIKEVHDVEIIRKC